MEVWLQAEENDLANASQKSGDMLGADHMTVQ